MGESNQPINCKSSDSLEQIILDELADLIPGCVPAGEGALDFPCPVHGEWNGHVTILADNVFGFWCDRGCGEELLIEHLNFPLAVLARVLREQLGEVESHADGTIAIKGLCEHSAVAWLTPKLEIGLKCEEGCDYSRVYGNSLALELDEAQARIRKAFARLEAARLLPVARAGGGVKQPEEQPQSNNVVPGNFQEFTIPEDDPLPRQERTHAKNGTPPADKTEAPPGHEREWSAVDYAKACVKRGWYVFPCWWIDDGHCTCGRCGCDTCNDRRRQAGEEESDCSPGKHPIAECTPHGVSQATNYVNQVKRWWERYPRANVALACGLSKLIVVDIDPRHGGDEDAFWKKVGGRVETVRTLTPGRPLTGRGLHLWFSAPEGRFTVSVGEFLPGIDIRAGNGYVMLPPSNHLFGIYEFEIGYSPKEIKLAPCPPILAEFARQRGTFTDDGGTNGNQAHDAGDQRTGFDILRALAGVPEGQRQDQIFRAACWFRSCNTAKVVTRKEILEAASRCVPPFPPKQARTILNRVYKKYPAGSARNSDSSASADPTADAEKIRISVADSMAMACAWSKEYMEPPEGRTLHRWDGQFWRWNGAHYGAVGDEDIRALLWRFLRYDCKLFNKDDDVVPPTSRAINEALDALKAHCNLPVLTHRPPCWICEPPLGIEGNAIVPVENGLLHLSTGELFPPTPRWFSFSVMATKYDPAADCREWNRFIEQLWPDDQQSRDTLQEMLGYFLTGDMSQQKSFMIIGPPRSGKGTIGRVIAALLGPEAIARPALADFAYQFGLEPLINKSVAIISDARLGNGASAGLLAERLLAISGEDSISVSRKFLPAWNGQLRVRFLVLANELPHFSDPSGALPSRFILLKTAKSYLGDEDPNLFSRLVAELSGILNWAIDGWMRLQERGHFIQPQSVREMAEDFAGMANPLDAFINEACELDSEKTTTIAELYRQYVNWSRDLEMKPCPVTLFGRDLRAALPQLRFFRVRSQPRSVHGIAPSETWRQDFDRRQNRGSF